MFAMDHVKPELIEIGLEAMHGLLVLISTEPQVATMFYQTFYLSILKKTL